VALIGKIAIAMGVDAAALGKGLQSARAQLSSFASEIKVLGIAAAAAGAYGFTKLVNAGSNLIENQNKVKAVFGESADIVIKTSEQMGAAFGTSMTEFQDAAGVFGGLFKNLGYASGDAAQLSVEMVKLAADVASFKNLSFDEALNKIRAGLTGESEPLKAIGVLINETAVETQALSMGLTKVNGQFTEQQKVQARLAILTKQLADAHGDLAKTADDVANATRGVQGRFTNLIETIGVQLQPIAKTVLGELSTGIAAAGLAWEDYGKQTMTSIDETNKGIGEQATQIGWLQKSVGFVADMWNTVALGFSAVQSYVTSGLALIVDGLGYLSSAFDRLRENLGYAADGGTEFLHAWSEDLKALSGKQWEGFQEKLAKPPPSEGINQYFDNARKKTAELRKELASQGVDVTKFKPVAAAGLGIKGENKFSSAMEIGSQEAVNTVLRSKFGGQGNKPVDQIKDNTKETVNQLAKLNDAVSGFGLQTVNAF